MTATRYVGPEGPDDARIMFVGEAPGSYENATGRPFVSHSVAQEEEIELRTNTAGSLLERYLGRVRIRRSEVFLTNLSKHRPSPKSNKFEILLNTNTLKEGLEELSAEIERVNPHLIVALGNWPMYFLTGSTASKGKMGTGIMTWRGSVIPGIGDHVPAAKGRKVMITLHPAFIIRPAGFGWHPVFFNDIKRVPKLAESPDIKYPFYEAYVDPPNVIDIAHEMSKSEWLTVDIETFGNTLACVGFADSAERGLCITYGASDGWEIAKGLLSSQQRKIFQYAAFDVNYMWWHYGWETVGYVPTEGHPGGHDTYIASANLLAELPKSLEFQTSIYTPFPYYKEDRKRWKKAGDLSILWDYNLKDVIATHWIAMEQLPELKDWYR